MLKWFWSMLGYKSESDMKRDTVLDYQYKQATHYLSKDNVEAKNIKDISKKETDMLLSQKQKAQRKGWSKDYSAAVKSQLKKAQKGKKKNHAEDAV
tara:strand:- start:111 stop:398 length:288 start_codon:yes stop_codon:yes gene_type:complete